MGKQGQRTLGCQRHQFSTLQNVEMIRKQVFSVFIRDEELHVVASGLSLSSVFTDCVDKQYLQCSSRVRFPIRFSLSVLLRPVSNKAVIWLRIFFLNCSQYGSGCSISAFGLSILVETLPPSKDTCSFSKYVSVLWNS